MPQGYLGLQPLGPPPRPLPSLASLLSYQAPAEPVAARKQKPRKGRTVLVGDSLGVGTAPHLKGVRADARVGRPSQEGVGALRHLLSGNVGRVVFDLGTNDPDAGALARSLHQARRVAGGRELIVPRVGGPDAAAKNRLLKRLDRQGKITFARWDAPLADGIHPTGQGYKRRARQLRRAL